MSNVLIALGGNALGNNPAEQLELVREAARSIVDLIEAGHGVIVAHGNGPQVGMIHQAFDEADQLPDVPMAEAVAMSQGYIGYHLQQALREELRQRNVDKAVASIVTQTVVAADDPAFSNPTKPIGQFYSKDEAGRFEKRGMVFVEDAGRGYRRVIPSPEPMEVVEIEVIRTLVAAGHIVIAGGGGGIPVIEQEGRLVGVDAVIDKDRVSELLARELDVDILFILTAVDQVAVDFGKPSQRGLDMLSVEEARTHIRDGQFPPGSMLPKVEAALAFVTSRFGREAIITSLERAGEAIHGKTGTKFVDEARTAVK
ncbi:MULTISPECIES: carbamate kinase [unclassified Exiguobacterium]|uniref:carbamate kinase n=1 Tax=unclassified Exiguobacterium TaxID=2644629 RepID=UPI00103D4C9E|nr:MULTISPECIES: carbamate kinase [unclassified Exiguobacterium]TCI48028.1 carbamate kinase [Exiguobacterium sp. SH5S32]TCI54912.1 carbamate kinase [Exiguobacterium sp. SH1S4]TCI74708.1 carbamate kinase [Exiguobacterium sp. SH1S1]